MFGAAHQPTPLFRKILLSTIGLLFVCALALRPAPAHAACASLPTNMGTVTFTLSVPTNGTYRFWAHVFSPSAGKNSFYLQVDNQYCQITVGKSGIMPSDQFTWIDYQNSAPFNKINLDLSPGNHTITLAGVDQGVGIDKILLTSDQTCTPTNTGANCEGSAATAAPSNSTNNKTPAAGTPNTNPATANSSAMGTPNLKARLVGALKKPITYIVPMSVILPLGLATLFLRRFRPALLTAIASKVLALIPHTNTSVIAPGMPQYPRPSRPWPLYIAATVSFVIVVATIAFVVIASALGISYTITNAPTISNGAKIMANTAAIGGKMVVFGPPSTTSNSPSPNTNLGSNQITTPGPTPPTGGAAVGNGISTDPNFFPIAVWDQTPESNAQNYKNIGVNTFIGLYNGTTTSAINALSAQGMALLSDQNATGIAASGSTMKGWTQMDEPDNAQANGSGGYDPCIAPSTIVSNYNSLKAADPSHRPVYLNMGRGVADTNWGGRGTCTGNTSMYPQYAAGADIVSFDVYPVNEGLPITYVAKGVDNLRSWAGPTKPLYTWIETTAYSGGTGPTPTQTKAEVWMAIIHGATGIGYFCHIFSPSFIEAGLLSSPSMSSAVAAVDAQITSLAPVLNSGTVANGATVTASSQVDLMTKYYGGATYVFAVGMTNTTTTATIRPAGWTNGTVTVLGENRSLGLSGGSFTDSFSGYGVHIYKITP